jgi:hypothetical protein
MKKSNKGGQGRTAERRPRVFRAGLLACVLLGAGVVTAVAKYESRGVEPARAEAPRRTAESGGGYVTVEVGGKKLRVNARTLQQGPLTQEQSQQIANALEGNKSTEGLVEVQHEDGSVSIDLEGRFQNVMLAKKNDDGSVSAACVDNPEAAKEFLQTREATPAATVGTRPAGKASVKE